MSEDKKSDTPNKPLETPPIQNETRATKEPVFIGDSADALKNNKETK